MIYTSLLYIQPEPEDELRVSKWGNSLGVRLPAAVVKTLGLKDGDKLEIHVLGQHSLAVDRAPEVREILERLRRFRGRMPEGFVFDRLEANERDHPIR